RGETADASTHDDQIVRFTCISRLGSIFPKSAVTDLVHGLEGANMRSAQTSLGGRVISGDVLQLEIGRRSGPHFGRNYGRSGGNCNAVQEIATRNLRAHSKFSITRV